MKSIARHGGVVVLVAVLVSSVQADGPGSSYAPYKPSYVASVPAPGCATPGMPSYTPPGAYPGMTPAPSPSPSTTPSPTPSTTPSPAPSPAPGMGEAGAAAGTGDTAGAAAGEAGSEATASAAPGMIGDLNVRGYAVTRSGPHASQSGRTPLVGQGSFKISDNESPLPIDRVFMTYNYFNNTNTLGGQNFDVHRATFGFEKTCFNGDASVGMRIPFQVTSDGGGNFDGFGDVSLLLKYALFRDHSNNVFSGGLVLTTPTGRDITLADGTDIHGWLIQPWVGGVYNSCNGWYVHGFTSMVVPSETHDASFVSNDYGVGYRVYQCDPSDHGQVLTAVIPTLEAHLTTPINHSGVFSGDVGFADQFVITAGVHLGLCNQAFLTLGGALPISGPKPESFELICQFNLRF